MWIAALSAALGMGFFIGLLAADADAGCKRMFLSKKIESICSLDSHLISPSGLDIIIGKKATPRIDEIRMIDSFGFAFCHISDYFRLRDLGINCMPLDECLMPKKPHILGVV